MNNSIIANALRFLVLLLVQVLILNEIELHGFIHPYIYPLFILLLPFETPRWVQLLLGFIMGLLIDVYANTIGFHAAATVWLAFIRTTVQEVNKPSGGYEPEQRPLMFDMGVKWTLFYVGVSVLLHHFVLFSIEAGSFANVLSTLSKIFVSSLVSIFLMMLYQFIFVPKQ